MKVNTGYLAFETPHCRFPLLRCVVRSFCLSFGPDQIGIICLAASRIGREKGPRPHQPLRRGIRIRIRMLRILGILRALGIPIRVHVLRSDSNLSDRQLMTLLTGAGHLRCGAGRWGHPGPSLPYKVYNPSSWAILTLFLS